MRRWLALVMVAAAAEATSVVGAPPDGPDGDGGSLVAPPEAITPIGGVLFAWPDLGAAPYEAPEANPWRQMVARWREGRRPQGSPPPPHGPAALYLAADLAFLGTPVGEGNYLDARAAYERALREAPDFPDAPRARFMVGQTNLALGFAPEAEGAFRELERRHPESPVVLDAKLGRARALGLAHRPAEARRLVADVLAQARGEVLCRARHADATLAGGAAAVPAFRELLRSCPEAAAFPGVVHDYARALAAAGDAEAARRLLASRPALADAEEARLHLLAGELAPGPAAARVEYERVLLFHAPPELALEAEMRVALLDAAGDPGTAADRLAALARRPAPPALHAVILGEAAEASARAGRFERALALLDEAQAAGPDGAAQAQGRRGEILGRWITSLATRGDSPGVATVYAAHMTDVEETASPEDRLAVARALGQVGLWQPAARLVRRLAAEPLRAELAAMVAEQAVAAGEFETARRLAGGLRGSGGATEGRARAVLARVALASGDIEAAAQAAAGAPDVALRGEVATRLLAEPGGATAASALLQPAMAGADAPPVRELLLLASAAAAQGAWAEAATAWRRALAEGAQGSERVEAAAGLARAAWSTGDADGAAAALASLADAGGDAKDVSAESALARRIVAAVQRSRRRAGGER